MMDYHKIAGMFPKIATGDLEALADDIRKHGLLDPIITFEGKVLDGRNRQAACLLAGVKPHYKAFDGTASEAIDFVWSENFHRRHLDRSQAAAYQIEHERLHAGVKSAVATIKADAKERTGGRPKQGEKPTQKIVEVSRSERQTNAKRAEMAGTNRTYIDHAARLDREAPDLFEKVKEGKIKITAAYEALRKRKGTPIPSRKKRKKRNKNITNEQKRAVRSAIKALRQALELAGVSSECESMLSEIESLII